MQDINEKLAKSYDDIPYLSSAFSDCSALKLEACGKLLGINPPPSKTAKILEIGSSFGGNLIPFAIANPASKIIGVDISEFQVKTGNEIIKNMGIRNLQLINKDICNLTKEDIENFGKFDYIICHGVYSWVPDFVKKAILSVMRDFLKDNGIGYISYNCYPGWKMKDVVRRIMLEAADNFSSMQDKLKASYEALDEFKELLEKTENPNLPKEQILGWIAHVKDCSPSYVAHEYLEEINDPLFFKDFAKSLEPYNLSYLCEANLDDIFRPDLGIERFDNYLKKIYKDRISQEQVIDLAQNRVFRQSLVVKTKAYEKVKDKEIGPNDIANINIVANYKKESETYKDQNGKPMNKTYNWLYEIFCKVYPRSVNLTELLELLPQDRKLSTYMGILHVLANACQFSLKPFESIAYQKGKTRLKPQYKRYLEYFAEHQSPLITFANEFGVNEAITQIDAIVGLLFDGQRDLNEVAIDFLEICKIHNLNLEFSKKDVKEEEKAQIALKFVNDVAKLMQLFFMFEEI